MTSIIDLLVTTGKWQMMHILLDDDLGRLTVQRLRPWHRLLARCLAPRLDRRAAEGGPARRERSTGRTGHGADLRQLPACPGREPAADARRVRIAAHAPAAHGRVAVGRSRAPAVYPAPPGP